MALSEFDIIEQIFKRSQKQRSDVFLGIGDDAALLKIPAKQLLAVSTDTFIAGIHFPINTKAYDIGYKALAVNLSDMAAMGATPAWATLALSLPAVNKKWLKDFAAGFFKLIDEYKLQLIGGDLTRSNNLSITVQIHGFVPIHQALTRHNAKPGDYIYVTGNLGDAGLALHLLNRNKKNKTLLAKLNCPTPRVKEGIALRGIAHSAIDISDGLISDLHHILKASECGATLWLDKLPLSQRLMRLTSPEQAIKYALCSGDDYELCFTISAKHEKKLRRLFEPLHCNLTCIGVIETKKGLRLLNQHGKHVIIKQRGFQHF